MTARLVIATALAEADGAVPTAAATAVAAASFEEPEPGGVLLVELGAERRRGPTMLASPAARRLEEELERAGRPAAARGRVCWYSPARDEDPAAALSAALEAATSSRAVVAVVPPESWRAVIEAPELKVAGGLLRAELPGQRRLAALAVTELRQAGARARVAAAAPGPVAARRAVAGLDPGGRVGARARRLARGLLAAKEWR